MGASVLCSFIQEIEISYVMGNDAENTLLNSLQDLKIRWAKARAFALRESGVMELDEVGFFQSGAANLLSEPEYEEVLKKVYLNSRNLGVGYQKFHNIAWDLGDVSQYLPTLGSPCLVSNGELRGSSAVFFRSGCESGNKHGSRFCQYWREAHDGLIIGLCENERYVRHECVTLGNSQCVDVVFNDAAETSESIWNNRLRWGPIPDERKVELNDIQVKFDKMEVDLVFLGLKEQQLFYKMESKKNLSCGSSGEIMRTHLKNIMNEYWPQVKLSDASPLAVYGEKT